MKTMKGRGGVVENIVFENITVDLATRDAIRISMRYKGEPLDDYSQPDHHIPTVRNFYINNFVCRKAPKAMTICGVKGHNIQNVHIANAHISAEKPSVIDYVENLTIENLDHTEIRE
jgi:hypothetical protein